MRDYAEGLSDNEKQMLYPDKRNPHPEVPAEGGPRRMAASAAPYSILRGSAHSRLAPHDEGALTKDEVMRGMKEMSEKYRELGSELYLDEETVKKANKGL